MKIYNEKVWMNWLMLVICIILPIISLPIIFYCMYKIRQTIEKKADERKDQISDILKENNEKRFIKAGWVWKIGPKASWLELIKIEIYDEENQMNQKNQIDRENNDFKGEIKEIQGLKEVSIE